MRSFTARHQETHRMGSLIAAGCVDGLHYRHRWITLPAQMDYITGADGVHYRRRWITLSAQMDYITGADRLHYRRRWITLPAQMDYGPQGGDARYQGIRGPVSSMSPQDRATRRQPKTVNGVCPFVSALRSLFLSACFLMAASCLGPCLNFLMPGRTVWSPVEGGRRSLPHEEEGSHASSCALGEGGGGLFRPPLRRCRSGATRSPLGHLPL